MWPLTGPAFAGGLADPIEAWLRCGPTAPSHTVVHGRVLVDDGVLTHPALDEMLASHATHSRRIQRL